MRNEAAPDKLAVCYHKLLESSRGGNLQGQSAEATSGV